MRKRLIARLAVVAPVALAAILFTPGTAHAYQVAVQVTGAGVITETTPAGLMKCTTPYSSTPINCLGGTQDGPYSWGWAVSYTATARPGYQFARWESPTGTAVICDEAKGATTYTGSTCSFTTYANLSVKAIFVDTTAPSSPVFSSYPSSPTNSTSAQFSVLSSSDPTLSKYQWRLDGGTWNDTMFGGVTLSNLTDGTHTFDERAVDYAGNTSFANMRSWTVDTVAPGVTLEAPTDGSATNAANVVVSGSTTGTATQVQVFDNGVQIGTATPAVSGAWTYTHVNPAAGTHSYAVKARDAAGNFTALTAAAVVDVDRTAPFFSVITPKNNAYDNDGTVKVSGGAEPSASVRVYEGATELASVAAASDGTWSTTLTGLAEGTHTLTIMATDRAGNATDPITRTVRVDMTAPLAAVLSPVNGAVGVSRTTNVVAVFSEAVKSATVTGTTVYLVRKGTTTKLVATVSYDPTTRRVTLDPRDTLRGSTVYVATVTRGVKDLAGNLLLTKLQWSFKTKA